MKEPKGSIFFSLDEEVKKIYNTIMEKEVKFTDVADVAYNNIKIIKKLSFDKTLDIKIGINDKGYLTIDVLPSSSWIDWVINFIFFPKKVRFLNNAFVHSGYMIEWLFCRKEVYDTINNTKELFNAITKKGLIVSGRSKGAGEAFFIALGLQQAFLIPGEKIYIGNFEGPKIGNKAFEEYVYSKIPKDHIYCVIYKNDIVPGIPFFYKRVGTQIQFDKRVLGQSFKDHEKACCDEDMMYGYIRAYEALHQ